MDCLVSVVIPNYNSSATIGDCLESAFSSRYPRFEVIVVDDCSTDNSLDIIGKFPCRIVRLDRHSGASRARNAGAERSAGDILFFTDADCVLREDTLSEAANSLNVSRNTVVGGTYTQIPFDDGFFSAFQSIFINYSETKRAEPDYVATHAMAVDRRLFVESSGFADAFLPILEDVEFSHRLRRSGCKLKINPRMLVRHIFRFTLMKSLRNAFRKSMFWTIYSLKNRDLLTDSGTASVELKINGAALFSAALVIVLFFLSKKIILLSLLPVILISNLFASRGLIGSFYRAKGLFFSLAATIYYVTLYPLAAGIGAAVGTLRHLLDRGKR
jgi:glycosyltransferase involved in cell wall biosynthesis